MPLRYLHHHHHHRLPKSPRFSSGASRPSSNDDNAQVAQAPVVQDVYVKVKIGERAFLLNLELPLVLMGFWPGLLVRFGIAYSPSMGGSSSTAH